jgi:hypothetical protein
MRHRRPLDIRSAVSILYSNVKSVLIQNGESIRGKTRGLETNHEADLMGDAQPVTVGEPGNDLRFGDGRLQESRGFSIPADESDH